MGPYTFPNTARARWFFWALVGLTALAAAIRFSTLGLQSYRHDEAVTAGRVLLASLPQTMHRVWTGESTPPLYYLLAWGWSHLFGVREVGLRSLSALFGTATVPVAYLAGRELVGRRTGLAVAAIVAVEPLLVWYSQDARAYALLVLLSTAAFVFFLRARRGAARDLAWWAVLSALALATHYFAFFPLAIEAAWLLLAARPLRRVLWALAGIALAGAALAPIALHQAQGKNNDWIATFGMVGRLRAAGLAFLVGETGLLKHALVPIALLVAAVGLLLLRGGAREKRGALVALAVGGGGVLLALAFAAAGQDFVLGRNLLPALVPLALVVAAGIAAPRAGWLGVGVGAALVAYLLAFCVYADFRPALQRDDWRSVARRIGPPRGPRAILAWEQGDEPLAFYLDGGEVRAKWKQWRVAPRAVSEVAVVSGRPPPPGARDALPPSFRRVERVTLGRMTLIRYRSARPRRLGWGRIAGNFTGYSNNAVLLDRPPG
jgi:4-amino-4-deoxy-L-arabinose transferase-like glycosyltransferase